MQAAALLDLTGDSLPDLVSLGSDGRVATRIQQGGGTFAAGGVVDTAPGSGHLAHGDLDGDGDDDVVVVLADTGTVRVLRNDSPSGDLTALTPTFDAGPAVSDLALADLDQDGLLDLICCHFGSRGLSWFGGVGDGTFRGRTEITAAGPVRSAGLCCADFNADGFPDLALCDIDGDAVLMLFGDGSGVPGNPVTVAVGRVPVAAVQGDVDGDGVDELVVANLLDESLSVIGQDSAGAFVVHDVLQIDGQPASVSLADVDGDGVLDLAAGILDHRAVALLRGLAAGGFAAEVEQLSCSGTPLTPIQQDLDGDGDLDVLVPALGAPDVNLFLNDAGRLVGGRLHRVAQIEEPEAVSAADLDGDGQLEVTIASFTRPELQILRPTTSASGDVAFESLVTLSMPGAVQNVLPADLDGDGLADLVVALQGGVKVLANNSTVGQLDFAIHPADPASYLAAGDGPFELVAADLDADGAVDIAAAYHVAGKVVVVRGVPGDPFNYEAPIELAMTGRPAGLAACDFDGDGALELAVSRINVSAVTVLELNGGVLEAVIDVPVGASPNYLRSADFDADGRDDLVVSGGLADELTVISSKADGSVVTRQLPAGDLPTALLTRDLNRDGKADVLVASMAGADFRVLLGDGEGGFQQALVFPGVYSAVTAAFGDLDGDGLEDLLIGSLFSQRLATFRNVSRADAER